MEGGNSFSLQLMHPMGLIRGYLALILKTFIPLPIILLSKYDNFIDWEDKCKNQLLAFQVHQGPQQ